ncbi:MAG: hypothetical protein LBM77_06300 [Spirochaetaceae bacterium]|jgi:hypothetical protein|nr:hypothetical protein [Spirochaetaceae bacterium]
MNIVPSSLGQAPSPEPIYNRLFQFLDNVLSLFEIKSTNANGTVVSQEDLITQDLVDYLEEKQEFETVDTNIAFKFENQTKEGIGITDIGVRLGRDYSNVNRKLFCCIEAKRLPTPHRADRDEREYVFVDKTKYTGNGGIQRFKNGKHAADHPYAVMVGYVQEKTPEYWHSKINVWINELASAHSNGNMNWSNRDEQLTHIKSLLGMEKYMSINKRDVSNDSITIIHYLMNLTEDDLNDNSI